VSTSESSAESSRSSRTTCWLRATKPDFSDDLRAEGAEVRRDVCRSPEASRFPPGQDDGHGGLRRDPGHVAPDVPIEHDVPEDGDGHPGGRRQDRFGAGCRHRITPHDNPPSRARCACSRHRSLRASTVPALRDPAGASISISQYDHCRPVTAARRKTATRSYTASREESTDPPSRAEIPLTLPRPVPRLSQRRRLRPCPPRCPALTCLLKCLEASGVELARRLDGAVFSALHGGGRGSWRASPRLPITTGALDESCSSHRPPR
jgi:hypothetical protein